LPTTPGYPTRQECASPDGYFGAAIADGGRPLGHIVTNDARGADRQIVLGIGDRFVVGLCGGAHLLVRRVADVVGPGGVDCLFTGFDRFGQARGSVVEAGDPVGLGVGGRGGSRVVGGGRGRDVGFVELAELFDRDDRGLALTFAIAPGRRVPPPSGDSLGLGRFELDPGEVGPAGGDRRPKRETVPSTSPCRIVKELREGLEKSGVLPKQRLSTPF